MFTHSSPAPQGRWQRAALTEGQPRRRPKRLDKILPSAGQPLHHRLRRRSPSPSKLGEELRTV